MKIMKIIIGIVLSLICLPVGILCMLKPETFKLMPVYRFYARFFDEHTTLMVVRWSAALGFIGLSILLFLLIFGVIGQPGR
jgi:hypothetical protein